MSDAGLSTNGGLITHDYTMRLINNQSTTTTQYAVTINKQLEHVVGVYVRGYNVRAPNNSALSPSLWCLELVGGDLRVDSSSNATGNGFYMDITNATNTFVDYTFPRLYSSMNQGRCNSLVVKITNADTGAPVIFADATISLVFVMKPRDLDVGQVLWDNRNLVFPNSSLAYDSRARYNRY